MTTTNMGTNHVAAAGAARNGGFGRWQPKYAAYGIATFPVNFVPKPDGRVDKVPAVRNYQRFGLKASKAIAQRFADARGIGFMTGPRSKVTVGDIDVADEKVLADFLDRHGRTPVIARTASGKFHAWFAYNGERRCIRPWEDLRIDLLGGGVVVAPPSTINDNAYTFIAGSLDDIDRLPTMRGIDPRLYRNHDRADPLPFVPDGVFDGKLYPLNSDGKVPAGRRNETLWTHCLANAHRCDTLDDMIEIARAFRDYRCELPASVHDDEVAKTAASAWRIHVEGRNRGGVNGSWNTLVLDMVGDPYLFALLGFLQATNRPGATFMVADGLAQRLGWPRRKLANARRQAVDRGYIVMIRKPGQGHPALYRFGHVTTKNR